MKRICAWCGTNLEPSPVDVISTEKVGNLVFLRIDEEGGTESPA